MLTTTGVFPSSVSSQDECDDQSESPQESEERVRDVVVQDVLRRVRYLLTLKGRPPFRLAGIEMYERLKELSTVLKILLSLTMSTYRKINGIESPPLTTRPKYLIFKERHEEERYNGQHSKR